MTYLKFTVFFKHCLHSPLKIRRHKRIQAVLASAGYTIKPDSLVSGQTVARCIIPVEQPTW